MASYPFDRNLFTERELLDYYLDAINYRNTHKDLSPKIAMHVFDRTHQDLRLSFPTDQEIIDLRYEFGALEAPGMPEDDQQDPSEYTDQLWQRLYDLVSSIKEKRAA